MLTHCSIHDDLGIHDYDYDFKKAQLISALRFPLLSVCSCDDIEELERGE